MGSNNWILFISIHAIFIGSYSSFCCLAVLKAAGKGKSYTSVLKMGSPLFSPFGMWLVEEGNLKKLLRKTESRKPTIKHFCFIYHYLSWKVRGPEEKPPSFPREGRHDMILGNRLLSQARWSDHSIKDIECIPLELINSDRDGILKAREGFLISKGKTQVKHLNPMGWTDKMKFNLSCNLFIQVFVYCIPPPITFFFYFCIILYTVTVYSIIT